MRTAQAKAEKFLQHVRLADERIVVRDKIICREAAGRLAWRRVTDISTARIHVNAEDTGIKTLVDDLVVFTGGVVAIRPVKKPICRMKEHSATVMPDGLV